MSKRESSVRSRDAGSLSSQMAGGSATNEQVSNISQRIWDSMEPAEQTQKVNELIRYLLMSDSQKLPIKRDEISKTILAGRSRAMNIVLNKANEYLIEVFGVEAVETKKGTQIIYILVNRLPHETKDKMIQRSDDEIAQLGLLGVILSYLLTRPQGCASEENVWTMLNSLGLLQESSQDPCFGSVKTTISLYIDQGYIDREKKLVAETNTWEYRWGPRANLEIDKYEMIKIMAEIHGEDFNLWERQFKDKITD